jgi:hypothetical protein
MRFYINGAEVTPINYEEISLIENKEFDDQSLSISTDSMIFVDNGVEEILKHLNNPSYGYFQGIPFQIVLDNGYALEYYLDPSDSINIQTHQIEIKVRRRFENRSFFNVADGTTFDLMAFRGVLFTTVEVPYIVKAVNTELELATLGFFAYQITSDLVDIISELVRVIGDVANGIGADPTDLAYAIAMAAMLLIKISAYVVALVNLIKRIKELVYPELRYRKAVSFKELIVKGCNHLGYSVESSLLDEISQFYYQGIPQNKTDLSFFDQLFPAFHTTFTRGYPTSGDRTAGSAFDYTTLGGMLRMLSYVFNGRIVVRDKVLSFERRDLLNNVQGGIVTALPIQSTRVDSFTPNTNEAWQRCVVRFQTDPLDVYTLDDFNNNTTEFGTLNNTLSNLDLNVIKGIKDVNIPFCFAKRRKDINLFEITLKKIFGEQVSQFISLLQNPFTGIESLTNPPKRIGVCVYSNEFCTVPKMLYLQGDKQPENYKDFIGSKAIFNNYHKIDFIGNNSFLIKRGEISEINGDIFVNLLTSDFVEVNGIVCELLQVTYNESRRTGEFIYKEPNNYATSVYLQEI